MAGGAVLDLSHPIDPNIPLFPGGTAFEVTTLATVEHDGYYLNAFTLGEHSGTHVDAPAHFVEGTATIDRIPVEQLVGVGAVIDVREAVKTSADYLLTVDDVKAWEEAHGSLSARHILLVHTGWSSRWPDQTAYRNVDAEGVMHFPGVSIEACRYVLAKGVRGMGIDTLSTDPGKSSSFEVHKLFHAAAGWNIENLTNLERLPPAGATIIVAPLPLARGSGAPARVLAILP